MCRFKYLPTNEFSYLLITYIFESHIWRRTLKQFLSIIDQIHEKDQQKLSAQHKHHVQI